MPGITRPEEGFIGVVDMIMADMNAWGGGARRAPPGKHEYYFSTALTDVRMRDPKRVGRVIELCETGPSHLPELGAGQEFASGTPGPGRTAPGARWARAAGRQVSPHVERLFFAGDQYGKRRWAAASTAASLSAVRVRRRDDRRQRGKQDHAGVVCIGA